jgi:hypothetical protein
MLDRLSEVYPEYKNISLSFPLFSATQAPPSATSAAVDSPPALTGPQSMARQFQVSYLGGLPMDPSVLLCGEQGAGLLEVFPRSCAATHLNTIVEMLISHCQQRLPPSQPPDMITDSDMPAGMQ